MGLILDTMIIYVEDGITFCIKENRKKVEKFMLEWQAEILLLDLDRFYKLIGDN